MDDNKIKLTDLVNYLKHPLQLKAERVFGKNYDDEEKLEEEFEPFKLDNLKSFKVVGLIANEVLNLDAVNEDGSIDKNKLEDVKRKCMLFNELPRMDDKDVLNDPLFTSSFNNSVSRIEELFMTFTKIFSKKPTKENILNLGDEINIDNCDVIINKRDVLFYRDGNNLSFIDIKGIQDNYLKNYFNIYIQSLLYVASLKDNNNCEFIIKLFINEYKFKQFQITKNNANEILNKIIDSINDNNYKFINVNLIEKDYEILETNVDDDGNYIDPTKVRLSNYYDIISGTTDSKGSVWGFFKDSKLFNDLKDLGYSNKENFEKKYNKAAKNYIKLISKLFVKNEEEKKEENNGK